MLKALFLYGPAKFLISVFGVGFLPVWSRHWAAFLGVLFCCLVIFFSGYVNREVDYILIYAAPNLLIASIYIFLLSFVLGFVFLHLENNVSDHFVLDVVATQCFVLAVTGPAILVIGRGIRSFFQDVCDTMFVCAEWFFLSVVVIVVLGVPFSFLRFFDIMEFWPSSYFNINYPHNVFFVIAATFMTGVYSILLIYFLAFLVYGLDVLVVATFFEKLFGSAREHFIVAGEALISFFAEDGGLHQFLRKIGVVHLVDLIFSRKETEW